MKLSFFILLFSIFTGTIIHTQHTVSGYIFDAESGESLISASVYNKSNNNGTVSNIYGFYSFTSSASEVELEFSYIGYQSQIVTVDFSKDTTFDVYLSPSVQLTEIEIIAESESDVQENVQMSQIVVPIKQIKATPTLFGEVDVIKALQLLPGVQSGSEGFSGLYVRGGSPDQNLVILDGVPIYNISHLFGIFSVFNADALKDVRLIKGGFPAQYGGRLSSVLDIRMKEGNLKRIEGEGSIGLISSKLTLQGPIIKDKTSFLISGRRTYLDLIARPFISGAEEVDNFSFFFHDLNAKIQHVFNDRHRVFASGFSGRDKFGIDVNDDGFRSSNNLQWGNTIGALRWNWKITDKMFSNTSLNYTNYELDIFAGFTDRGINENDDVSFATNYVSAIEDVSFKVDIDYIPSTQHYVKFGASVIRHQYAPGALTLNFEAEQFEVDTLIGTNNQESIEYYVYVQDELSLGKFKANVGLHFSGFNVESTNYTSVQPRISLRYLPKPGLSFKASYSQMTQYINLLTSESLLLPTDLWVPSTARIRPQNSWQVAGGVSKKITKDIDLTVEGFYKKMNDVLSFQEGASFLFGLDGDWQDQVTQGQGETYGMEVLLQKKQGRLSGWLGYTLSWNERQFDDINFGRPFPFRYDRRHDFSLVLSYQLGDRISLSGNWIYGTGNAVTIPGFQQATEVFAGGNGQYFFNSVAGINDKNGFRMSNVHRLDFGISFKKKKKWGERTWVIGVYNAYSRSNPFYLFWDEETEFDNVTGEITESRTLKELSVLPLIPSVSYNFKF